MQKKTRLTQSWAIPHGSSRHSPSGVTSAPMLVPSGRQRTGAQVGDGGELWDEKVERFCPSVTGPRRAVTHCDCTRNAPQLKLFPSLFFCLRLSRALTCIWALT